MQEGCGFDLRWEHIQDMANEFINKWDNKSVFLSLHPYLFLSFSVKHLKN